MTKYTSLRSLVLLSGILLIHGCGESPRTGQANSGKAPTAIQEFTAQQHDIALLYTATGTVHARVESQLASQLMARVLTVNVHAGDRVREGQTLLTLSSRETDAGYHKVEAVLAEAQNSIAETESGIAAAKANLDLAGVTAERMNDLYSKRSISKQELDETNARLKTAQANYEMAKARREELTSRIEQSNAALQQAQVSRSYTQIRAPFAGVVTARNAEAGTLAVPGNPLLTLEAGDGYQFRAEVEESRISLVHLTDTVAVSLDAQRGEIRGRVREVSPISDVNSHSYTVKIDLPPTEALHSGQFGHVSFMAGSRQAMTVPTVALVENGQLVSLFVSEDGVAHARLVTLGDKREGQVEVLSGLQHGDRVICPVPLGLADGDKVGVRR
jgi:RND family efflux transporter MFP subunit